jgi:hypothetical protein
MTTYSGTMSQYMTQTSNGAEMEQAVRTRLAARGSGIRGDVPGAVGDAFGGARFTV